MKGEVALCHHNLTSAWLTNVFLFLRSVAFPWLCTPVVALCNFCQRGAPGLPLYRCSRYLLLSCNLLLKFIFTSINSVPSVSVNFLYLISLGQGVCIFFNFIFYARLFSTCCFMAKESKAFCFFVPPADSRYPISFQRTDYTDPGGSILFLPTIIVRWNKLPAEVAAASTLELFKSWLT